jgi:hypothetical protein
LDPQLTKDGKPYGPWRFKEIVRERYLISKNTSTSYNEVGQLTPKEREYIIEFIADEIKRSKDLIEQQKLKNNK